MKKKSLILILLLVLYQLPCYWFYKVVNQLPDKDTLVVLDKKPGQQMMTNGYADGTFVKILKNGKTDRFFVQNPFDAETWKIGQTYIVDSKQKRELTGMFYFITCLFIVAGIVMLFPERWRY